ncbi:hypothetical protein CLV67_14256 [Actinoplanes italicus]|uniref:Helix-turn-helix protein n=2 Tax=Actinoplanes italicus TaxID=113567 RepID=A0A2T0JIJ0_9ACTN|nr:hypothetical protein CLV67_14256 [Actinoplanes italicus]
MPATVREWTEVLARIRFGTVRVAGKGLSGARIKAVAYRIAFYADGNGTRVRPGVARLALDVETDYSTARRVVALLRQVGLLGLVRAGGRGRGVDEFRLTLPVDLLERDDLTVWSPTDQRAAIDRLSATHRGDSGGPDRGPGGGQSVVPEGSAQEGGSLVPQGSAQPVDNSASLIPQGSAQAVPDASIADPSGTPKTSIADPSGTQSLIPQGSATHQRPNTRSTHHPGEDVSATVTTPGAPGPTTNPEPPPRPKRCEHGLEAGHRRDGQLACPICRHLARTATPAPDGLAPVISLNTRRPA